MNLVIMVYNKITNNIYINIYKTKNIIYNHNVFFIYFLIYKRTRKQTRNNLFKTLDFHSRKCFFYKRNYQHILSTMID